MGLDDPYEAYCFDEAIGYLGNWVKRQLDEIDGKTKEEIEGKRKLVMAKIFDGWVSDVEQPETREQKFRDPMLDLMDKPRS